MKKFLLKLILSNDERKFIKSALMAESVHCAAKFESKLRNAPKLGKSKGRANILIAFQEVIKLF